VKVFVTVGKKLKYRKT